METRAAIFLILWVSMTMPAGAADEKKQIVAEANKRALAAREKQQWDEAIRYFDEAIRLDPANATAYGNRGVTRFDKGEINSALVDLDQAVTLDPEWFYWRGCVLMQKGEWDKAIADFDLAITRDPNDSDGYYNRSRAWFMKKDWGKSLADASESIRLNPRDSECRIGRATIWLVKEDWGNAIADLDKAIELSPKNSQALASRACVWGKKEDWVKAVADFDRAIELDPKDARVYCNRGAAWAELRQWDNAIADFKQSISLDSSNANAFTNRGVVQLRRNCMEDALLDFNRAIFLEPKNVDAIRNRASVIWSLNRQAGPRTRNPITIAPMAASAAKLGRFEIFKLESVRPEGIDALLQNAMAELKEGKWAKALSNYDVVVNLDRWHPEALTNRAWIRAASPVTQLRDYKIAFADAYRACELTSWNSPGCLEALAASYAEAGQFEAAIKWQRYILQVYPEYDEARDGARVRLQLYMHQQPVRAR